MAELYLNEAEVLALQSILQPLAKAEAAFIRPTYVDLRSLRRRLGQILEACEEEKGARKTSTEITIPVHLARDLPSRKKAKKKGRKSEVSGSRTEEMPHAGQTP